MINSVPLQLDAVSKNYGSVQALKPLTLRVEPGEMLALLGPSGCGKTTTLRIIAGFEMPDSGSVLIDGKDVTELPPNKRALGMVFQNYSLFPHMSVGENVAFGLKIRSVDAAERTKRVRAMLALVRLDQYEDRQIHQLSGGQQQRIALARSLVTDPTILLLDEPLGALDKNLRERMQFELRELQRRLGITSILVTHDQEEALTMSDRVAVMSSGEVVQVGSPTNVYERPKNRFVSEFLGTANVFGGVIARQDKAGCWVLNLNLPAETECVIACTGSLKPGQPLTVAVRPERLRIGACEKGAISAVVQDAVFRGSYFAYEIAVAGNATPVFVYSQKRVPIPADRAVGLTFAPDDAIVFADAGTHV